jgi:ABC-type transport system substrate-binding protein
MPGVHTWYYAEYNDDLCTAQGVLSDDTRRTSIYQGAEAILIGDPALIPLYHPLVNLLVNPQLKGAALAPDKQQAVTLRDYQNSGILAGLYKAK